ncbi:hypothetical protein [Streptomyces sp. NPDC001980]
MGGFLIGLRPVGPAFRPGTEAPGERAPHDKAEGKNGKQVIIACMT